MSHINFHPAPGFGELLPGSFVVPHNPIVPASYVPHIGELLPAKFTIPENPLLREISGLSSLRPGGSLLPQGLEKDFPGQGHAYGRGRNISMAGLGACGCINGMCGQACEGLGYGMGELDLGSVATFLPYVLGAGLLFLLMAPGGREYREAKSKARDEYQAKVGRLRAAHRGYKRAGRRIAGGIQAAAA